MKDKLQITFYFEQLFSINANECMIFVFIFMHFDIKLTLFPIQNFQYLFNLLLFTTDIYTILELMIKENRKTEKKV